MDYEEKIKKAGKKETELRILLAENNLASKFYLSTNNDITDIPYFLACYSKSLPHDNKGRVDKDEINKIFLGVRKSKCYFNKINYGGEMRLANPSAIYSMDLLGPLKYTTKLPTPPSFTSEEAASEIVEIYEMALLRDLRFDEYHNSKEVVMCLKELNKLKNFTGPKENGKVTLNTLFRGDTKGDLIGPYISQFLLQDCSYGVFDIQQKYKFNKENKDFLTTWENALSSQNGITKEKMGEKTNTRYMSTLRDLASYVQVDDTLEAALFSLLILDKNKCPTIIPDTPLKEAIAIDLTGIDIKMLICESARISLLASWYHKWNVLKARPEAAGMEVHLSKTKSTHNSFFDNQLLCSNVLKRTFDKYGSYLLTQAWAEGCPTHPSYPGGHSIFIGAATTILKAFYNEDFMIDSFIPDNKGSLSPLKYKLKVGDELNKLASNIAIGRCAAGIHYRSDCVGLKFGEAIAIKLLKETVLKYTYDVTFKFHKRNGKYVRISNIQDK